ncbi:MAG: transposase, partial [Bacteroidia bacterium]|nr:transposase [Bacteroidia bacterium]
GVIKNNYLYPYGPKDMASLKKLLSKAVHMYNTGKPHKALGKLTPKAFQDTIDNENNSASYLPLSTANQHNNKRSKLSIKKVNVI